MQRNYKMICVNGKRTFLHRYVASLKLGRELKKKEHVHHIDGNKFNNDIENLMIFATGGDHTAYHEGNKAIEIEKNLFMCERKTKCKCGQKKDYKAKMCLQCRRKKNRQNRPTFETLKNDLSLISYRKVGRKYGVSDNTIRKWIKWYGYNPKILNNKGCSSTKA